MQEIFIATAKSRRQKTWKNEKISWKNFGEKLKYAVKTKETFAEYQKMSKEQKSEIKDVGGFVGGYLENGQRNNLSVVSRSVITLDADYACEGFIDELQMFHDYEMYVYSTHSHSREAPRYRLIILLDREVSADEYAAISRKVASMIGIDYFDDTTYQPARLMYYPSCSKDAKYEFYHLKGSALCVDDILSSYKNWQDISEWPESSRSEGIKIKHAKKQGEPAEKPGLIGIFNRAYTIEEAIATFLADAYGACNIEGRYTYLRGSTAAGLVVYGNKFAYSNHSTDPASGMLCNAFDLVRVHKFSNLDIDTKSDTPINKCPSFVAMSEFITKDSKCKQLINQERMNEVVQDFETDISWMERLELTTKGAYAQTTDNIKIIIENDVRFTNGITGHNLLKDTWEKDTLRLSWTSHGDVWIDSDDVGLVWFLEKHYNITKKNKILEALDMVYTERAYHPVRDYLNSLPSMQKDEVEELTEKLETLLIRKLGVRDTEYTRKATRLMMVGAVARVMSPGLKFDNMVVLVGPQGAGKSFIINKLSRGWYTDTITTVNGKEAYEALDGVWLVEMAELTATRKAEVEAVKHFISKQEDRYRKAYAKRADTYKRQCIFIGTTNTKEFLRDTTGNRRMLPLTVGEVEPIENVFIITDAEIDDLWRIALYLYRKGEKLYLQGNALKGANVAQDNHLEVDPRRGAVIEYLNIKLPGDWNDLDLQERRTFIHDDIEKKTGTTERVRVCAAEIWCELFEKKLEDFDRLKAREINNILESIDVYMRINGPKKFGKIYGLQRGFELKK